MTNWNNLDLESDYERSLNLLEPIDIETFLLEINCNLRDINESTVRAHFEESLQQKVREARDIFRANLKNFVKFSKKGRDA